MKRILKRLSVKVIIYLVTSLVILTAVLIFWLHHTGTQDSQATRINQSKQPDKTRTSPNTPTPAPQTVSHGWHITTYYTAVEKYHHQQPEAVRGCSVRNCANGNTKLGDYPADFVEKVKNEGAGQITSGTNAGHYLNWAYDTAYWIDTIPSDTNGHPLQPFASAAADSDTLAQNTSFLLIDCGTDASAVTQRVCNRLQSATWRVVDHFTPGIGGPRHIDLYIGEENQDNFETSDQYVDLTNVSLRLL